MNTEDTAVFRQLDQQPSSRGIRKRVALCTDVQAAVQKIAQLDRIPAAIKLHLATCDTCDAAVNGLQEGLMSA